MAAFRNLLRVVYGYGLGRVQCKSKEREDERAWRERKGLGAGGEGQGRGRDGLDRRRRCPPAPSLSATVCSRQTIRRGICSPSTQSSLSIDVDCETSTRATNATCVSCTDAGSYHVSGRR